MSTNANVGSTAKSLKLIFIGFAGVLLILNAALTGQFGLVYGGGIFAAIFLVLNFDGGAIAWYTARLQTNLSGTQRAIAKIMSVVDITGSILVSVIAVLLNFTLVDLSAYTNTIGQAGTWLVVSVCAMNTGALFLFQFFSVKEQKIEANEELSAQTTDEVQAITAEAHTKAMARARKSLSLKTDAIGDRIALDVEREFLRTMGCLDMFEGDVSPTPPIIAEARAMTEDEINSLLDKRLAALNEGADAGAKQVEPAEEPDPIDDDASGYIDHPAPMPEPLDLEEFRNDTGMHSRPARGK